MSNKETKKIEDADFFDDVDEVMEIEGIVVRRSNKAALDLQGATMLGGYSREYYDVLERLHRPLTYSFAEGTLNQFFGPENRTEAQRIADALRELSNVLNGQAHASCQRYVICPTNEAFLDRWVKSIKPSKQEFAENRIRDLLGFRFQEDFVEAFIEEYRSMTPKEFNRWYYSNIETRWQSEIKLKELVNYCQVAHEGEKGWNYDNIKKLT